MSKLTYDERRARYEPARAQCEGGRHVGLGMYQGQDLRWYRRRRGDADELLTRCPTCHEELPT